MDGELNGSPFLYIFIDMWKPIYQPEPWPQYLKKKENIGVPLMEVRKKYMEEQLLFENYVSSLQQLNVLSPSSGVSGGPSPSVVPPSPPPTTFVDVLDVSTQNGVEQWTFGFGNTWGWINPIGNRILSWTPPEDPNNDPAIWQVSPVQVVKPTCTLPYFEVEVGIQCPSSGIPSTGWNLGVNPCYTPFNVSNNSGGVPLNYPTSKVAQFNLVTGDATADQLPDGQLFTIDNVDLIMCPNLPTFRNGFISGNDKVYRFPAAGAGEYIGLNFNGSVWEIAFDDPSTKGDVILATGGDRTGFAGKTFTSTPSAATPFTAVIDYP